MDYFLFVPSPIMCMIFSYLDTTEVAKLASVNKIFYETTCECLHSIILKMGWGNPNLSDAIQVFGNIYSKQVVIYKSWSKPKMQTITFNGLRSVQDVKFGNNHVAILTHDGNVLTNLGNSDENTNLQPCMYAIKQIECNMDSIIGLNHFNKCELFSLDGGQISKFTWEVEGKISAIAVGVSFFVGTEEGKVFAWVQSNQIEIEFPLPNTDQIKDLKATPKILLILTSRGMLYTVDLFTFKAKTTLLETKNIALIAVGYSHAVALAREEYPPLKDWTPQFLGNWMANAGFEDCCRLIANHRITGEDIDTRDEDYLFETLGIKEANRRAKLNLELSRVKNSSVSLSCELYGWGRNSDMQIGIDKQQVIIPTKMILPELHADESFKSISCDRNYTFLFTNFGRIFVQGGKPFKKMSKEERKNYLPWTSIEGQLLHNLNSSLLSFSSGPGQIGIIFRRSSPISSVKVKMSTSQSIIFDVLRNSK